MNRALVIAVVLGAMAMAAPSHAAHQSWEKEYVAGFLGDLSLNLCDSDNPTGMNIDRVCFDVVAGNTYRVNIDDIVTGSDVGYLYVFRNASGGCVDASTDPLDGCPNSSLTCGTQTLSAPAGAVQLTILLDGPAFGPLDCLVDGPGNSAGIATQGTVKLTRIH